jgi:hypothetical protein
MNKTTWAVMLVSWLSAVPACAQSTSREAAPAGSAAPAPTAVETMQNQIKAGSESTVTFDGQQPFAVSGPILIRGLDARTEKGTYLGLTASPVPPVVRDQLRLRPGIGLVVDFVRPDSPAAAAGLQQHDIVEKLDDQLLVSIQQLAILVRMHKPGDEVKLAVIREAKPQVLSAKLAEEDVPPLAEVTAENTRYKDALAILRSAQNTPSGGFGGWSGNAPAKWAPGNSSAAYGIVWSDKENTFEITQDKERRLVAKDKAGKVIFEGPIQTDDQIEKLPVEIRDKVKKIKVMRLDQPKATTVPAYRNTLKSITPPASPKESSPRGGV